LKKKEAKSSYQNVKSVTNVEQWFPKWVPWQLARNAAESQLYFPI